MTQFTTIKEYDNAVRASQRKLKGLNERLEANPLDGVAQQARELAQAGHKLLLASRAKFKETGVSSPQLRDVQALALEEGAKLAQGLDHGSEPGVSVDPDQVTKDETPEELSPRFRQMLGRMKRESRALLETGRTRSDVPNMSNPPRTAAEPQAPTPRDRSREFVPSARVIRERAHAGAMRAHKFAPDDSRAQGLGYKSRQRKAEQKRRVMSLGITPKFPAMRDATCFLMRNSSRRILVNGQAWGLTG